MKTTHNIVIAYLFLIFGWIGFHRFYLGYKKSGFLYACTLGLCGLGILYDIFVMKRLINNATEQYVVGDADYSFGWILFLLTGFLGLHKLYISRPFVAFLYFVSAGYFGLGLIYDLFTFNEQISEFNKKNP